MVSLSTTCWGAEESLLLLAGHVTATVRVIAPSGDLLDRAAAAGLATTALTDRHVLRLSQIGSGVGAAGTAPTLTRAARALAGLPIWDASAAVSFSQWLHLPLALAGRARRRSVALDLHDGPFSRSGAAVQSAAAWTATRSVAVSATALAHLRSWPRGRTTTVPRPVELPAALAAGRARTSPADQVPRLAVVGRLDPEKRLDIALQAHARLRSQGVLVELDVVGAPHHGGDTVAELAGRWPLATFHGRLPHGQTLELLCGADALLSTAPGEAFGRTVAEAALLGVPAVVSGGGPAELVEDGRTGFEVAPGDAEALASLLGGLLQDRASMARAGDAARQKLSTLCDPDRVGRAWLAAVRP